MHCKIIIIIVLSHIQNHGVVVDKAMNTVYAPAACPTSPPPPPPSPPPPHHHHHHANCYLHRACIQAFYTVWMTLIVINVSTIYITMLIRFRILHALYALGRGLAEIIYLPFYMNASGILDR